jgi:DNA adenine methylase
MMAKEKMVTTKPLVRYPGSKSRKTKKLTSMFPEFTGTYMEPFIGSGVISIYQGEINPVREIWINDIYTDLYNLWINVRDNADELVARCIDIRARYPKDQAETLGKTLLNEMTLLGDSGDSLDQAVSFFVCNKISFSGVGGLSKLAYRDTFNDGNTTKLLRISDIITNFRILNTDYRDLFAESKENDFIFLDPPYDIKDMLYGPDGKIHAGFDHREFFEAVDQLKCKWMVTYNDNEQLREWYKEYNIIDEEYLYCMSFETNESGEKKARTKNELIITNYEIKT